MTYDYSIPWKKWMDNNCMNHAYTTKMTSLE